MMWYAFIGIDNENSLSLRQAARPAHVARLNALRDEGRLLLAGPFPAIDAEDPGPAGFSGSLIVAEFEDLAVVRGPMPIRISSPAFIAKWACGLSARLCHERRRHRHDPRKIGRGIRADRTRNHRRRPFAPWPCRRGAGPLPRAHRRGSVRRQDADPAAPAGLRHTGRSDRPRHPRAGDRGATPGRSSADKSSTMMINDLSILSLFVSNTASDALRRPPSFGTVAYSPGGNAAHSSSKSRHQTTNPCA